MRFSCQNDMKLHLTESFSRNRLETWKKVVNPVSTTRCTYRFWGSKHSWVIHQHVLQFSVIPAFDSHSCVIEIFLWPLRCPKWPCSTGNSIAFSLSSLKLPS